MAQVPIRAWGCTTDGLTDRTKHANPRPARYEERIASNPRVRRPDAKREVRGSRHEACASGVPFFFILLHPAMPPSGRATFRVLRARNSEVNALHADPMHVGTRSGLRSRCAPPARRVVGPAIATLGSQSCESRLPFRVAARRPETAPVASSLRTSAVPRSAARSIAWRPHCRCSRGLEVASEPRIRAGKRPVSAASESQFRRRDCHDRHPRLHA